MMNLSKRLLLTIYISVSIYLVLSFVYGSTGIKATENLLLYKNILTENISELQKINKNLILKYKPYNDMHTIKLKAYEMGYVNKNQKKIHIRGIVKPDISHILGKIIYKDMKEKDQSPFIRSASLIFSLIFYISSIIFLPGKNGIKKIRK